VDFNLINKNKFWGIVIRDGEILGGLESSPWQVLQPMLITCFGVCGLRILWVARLCRSGTPWRWWPWIIPLPGPSRQGLRWSAEAVFRQV